MANTKIFTNKMRFYLIIFIILMILISFCISYVLFYFNQSSNSLRRYFYIESYESDRLISLANNLSRIDLMNNDINEYFLWIQKALLSDELYGPTYQGNPSLFTIEMDYNRTRLEDFLEHNLNVYMATVKFSQGFEYIISLIINDDGKALFIVHTRLYDPIKWADLINYFGKLFNMYNAVPFKVDRSPPFNWSYVLWRYYLDGKGSYVVMNNTKYPIDAVILIDETPLLRDIHGRYLDVIEDIWASLVRSKMLWLGIRLIHPSRASLEDIYEYAINLGVKASIGGLSYCYDERSVYQYGVSGIHLIGCGVCEEYTLASMNFLSISLAIPSIILVVSDEEVSHAITSVLIPSEIDMYGLLLNNDYSGDGLSEKIIKVVDTAQVSINEFYTRYVDNGSLQINDLYLRIYDPIYWAYPLQHEKMIYDIYWSGPSFLQPLPYGNITWNIMHRLFIKVYPPASPIEKKLFRNLYLWHLYGCRRRYIGESQYKYPIPPISPSPDPKIKSYYVNYSFVNRFITCKNPVNLTLPVGKYFVSTGKLHNTSLLINVSYEILETKAVRDIVVYFDMKIFIKINTSLIDLIYPPFTYGQVGGFGKLKFYGITINYRSDFVKVTAHLRYNGTRFNYLLNDYIVGSLSINTAYGNIVIIVKILRNSNISVDTSIYTT